LSKDSNLTSTAWENDNSVATRLASMENFYEHMKSQMEGTSFQQSSMKEMIEMMKQRSKLFKNSHIFKNTNTHSSGRRYTNRRSLGT
jgi:hypothetical protein